MPDPTLDESIDGSETHHRESHSALHAQYNGVEVNRVLGQAAYTLQLSDANSFVEFDHDANAVTVTIPTNAVVAFPIGTVIQIYQRDTGTVTVTPDSGVTLQSVGGVAGARDLSGRWAEVSLLKRDTDDWAIAGELA